MANSLARISPRILNSVGLRQLSSTSTKPLPYGPQSFVSKETVDGWSKDDFRNARFLNKNQIVKAKISAQELIAKVPPKEVNTRVVSCDGGGGALGHPRVYINLDSNEPVTCIYCGLRYVYKAKNEDH